VILSDIRNIHNVIHYILIPNIVICILFSLIVLTSLTKKNGVYAKQERETNRCRQGHKRQKYIYWLYCAMCIIYIYIDYDLKEKIV